MPEKNIVNDSIVDNFEEIIQSQILYARSLIVKRSWSKLDDFLHEIDSHEVASVVTDLNSTDKILVFRLLSEQKATEVFMNLDSEEQEKLLFAFTDSEAGSILTAIDPDDRTRLLGDLPPTVVTKLLKLLPLSERKIANTLLNYPEDSAGRIMTPEFVVLSPEITAMEALTLIKQQSSQKETIYTSYIVDEDGVLIGSITLEDLILAPDKKRLKDFMKENPVCSSTHTDQEEIIQLINYYELMVLPITDTHHRLVGIVTHDDVIGIIHEEVTEDFHRFAAITPNEVSYISGSLWSMVINRSGWIIILLLIAGFTQDFLIYYGAVLKSQWLELSIYFTVLVGVGGNIGSQSSVLVIRGLTTGEISNNNVNRLLFRALMSGLMMGILLAGVLLLRILVFHTGDAVKWIVTLSLLIIVVLSNLLGAIFPLLLKRLKLDPAIVSAPLIATLMDIGGLLLYLEIAKFLLPNYQ